MTQPTSKDLSRCPHCGATAHGGTVHIEGSKFDRYVGASYVVCDHSLGGCGASGGFRDNQDEAIALWNRRAPESAHEPKVCRCIKPKFYRDSTVCESCANPLPTQPPPVEWQPIETAPKGVKLIAGYPNRLGKWRSVMACYYLPGTLACDDDSADESGYAPEGWYEESETHDHIMRTDEPPTHWMPLPKSPTATKSSEHG
jgi:hypothetical protein